MGIFPSNYVEKLNGPSPTVPSVAAQQESATTTDEGYVLENAYHLDSFQSRLSNLNPRESLAENDALQV